ncbi:MAG: sulfatase-like hydrolase/transferase [Planctomycetaceae bacterium]|nr:sulfatase-like hydrolase/transferase [Planctomycetaceae bacterium]
MHRSLERPTYSNSDEPMKETRCHRREFYFLLAVLLLGLLCDRDSIANEQARPNFIIIMVDDMGYEGVSCFGNPYFETPEIDRLASEGMRLTDFHSSGTVCSPTRAGLLTGRYQQRAGIEAVIHPRDDHPEHRKGLQTSETTFAEVLQKAGYSTGIIGKWHQGYPQNSPDYHPQSHGFDDFIGYHSGNIDFVSHVGDHYRHDWWHGRQETVEDGYTTHLVNRYADKFIRRHAKDDAPFCLYVAHEAIHNPVQVPGDPVRRTVDKWERWKWQEHTAEQRIAKFKGMTMPLDEGVGQIRKTLVELGIDHNTFVLFFSDNGPAGDWPDSDDYRGQKGSIYEGGHKVPAIAWWPGKIKAGSSSNQPLISIDVMPTLLDLSEAECDVDLDGVSFREIVFNNKSLAPRPLYWASLSNGGGRSEAIRQGKWKLVVLHPKASPGTFENPRAELYNLEVDPGETTNIAEQYPRRVASMQKQLRAWYADTQATATKQPGGWIPSNEN